MLLLFLLGGAAPRASADAALGAERVALLLELGLLVRVGTSGGHGGDCGDRGGGGEGGGGGGGSGGGGAGDDDDEVLVASPVQVYPVPTGIGEEEEEEGEGAQGTGAEEAAAEAEHGGAEQESSDGELLVATDWARESLLPTKYAVRPDGGSNPRPAVTVAPSHALALFPPRAHALTEAFTPSPLHPVLR